MKRQPQGASRDLAYFQVERNLHRNSPLWQQISVWQRQGFVRLTWNETADFARVKLTDAGLAEVEKL